MMESAIMEYAKWFIGAVAIIFIGTAVVFMFKLNEVNSFQQEVNYQIERHGGLTQEAKMAINKQAKAIHGGCIVASPDDGAPCLFEEDRKAGVKTSGFFVREYKVESDGKKRYYDRASNEQARYGTAINYVVTRQIGNIDGASYLKPTVAGTSASRVRGTSDS